MSEDFLSRAEHVRWCKQRALEYWKEGDLHNAVASMVSDMSKHPATRGVGGALGMVGLTYVMHGDSDGVKRWIEGFTE